MVLDLGCGDRGRVGGAGHAGFSPRPPVCLAPGEPQKWGALTYLDGQHPYGEGSSQVDVGFESVEDHCVTALGGKDQR